MEIQIFSNSKFGQLRVALNENGETVFCLADVCKALGIVEPSRVKERLDCRGDGLCQRKRHVTGRPVRVARLAGRLFPDGLGVRLHLRAADAEVCGKTS